MMQRHSTAEATTAGGCVHHLFEHTVNSYPDNIALIGGTHELSFQQLNTLANHFASALVRRGVGRGDLVAIALDRSVDLVVALLGVLKSGAAYVPVDIGFPIRRIRQMMDDAGPKFVICRDSTLDALSSWRDICLSVDDIRNSNGENNSSSGPDGGNLDLDVRAEDLAYIIYTSGSTGKPKGVEISHGAVSNLLSSMQREPGCDQTDRLLAITTISFDIAVLELFLPLVCGAKTVIAQAHQVRDAGALIKLLKHHAITMMQGTPATWQLLLDSGWQGTPRLGKVLCGGEALSRRLADRLLSCADSVWNMYGPTEATVWASVWRVRLGGDVLIGRPIDNMQFYILGEDLSPVPQGSPGELYIGGAGVARGYHRNPELTRSRFIGSPRHGGILYQTGDLARCLAPDEVVVLGRVDDQVKIRGHRIELGDIEAALAAHEDVSKAVVVSRADQLVAYCVRKLPQVTDEDQARSLAEWTATWDHAYETTDQDAVSQDAILNLAGWRNSYDGLPFSTNEMRDWQSSSVRRILSYGPERVMEIGSGTGMMLFSIAPHSSIYYAIDSSRKAVEFVHRHLGLLPHVTCEHREAHALPVIEQEFDTVIVNSVIQYFPSIDYLVLFLEWAVQAVGKGRIYLGDVRNLALLNVFHGDILHSRIKGQIPAVDLASRAAEAAKADRELVLSPDFFASLANVFPRISHVDITLRDGDYDNEMTLYRFDVTLHIGERGEIGTRPREVDWRTKVDLSALKDELMDAAKGNNMLRLNNVPNGRLRNVHSRLGTILGYPSYDSSSWVHPRILHAVAGDVGMQSALLPSRSNDVWSFDAVFWQAGQTPDLTLQPPKAMDKSAWAEYANVPNIGKAISPATLDRVLRPWLADRLPTYMMPSFFVVLDALPLTPNGKIDRKRLPDPLVRDRAIQKPATQLEADILAVWSRVLGQNGIDVKDNFFQVGGDSLRVTRVQTELEQLLRRPILLAKLFEHYTVKTLAAYLAEDMSNDVKTDPKDHVSVSHNDEDIAVVSMACRLPGGVTTPEEFWKLLESGGDAISEVPKARWDAEAIYNADPDAKGTSYCRQGGFLDTPIDCYDTGFFGISPREARSLDPMQYMVLETCWESFERAGYTSEQLRGSQTGVYVGVSNIPAYSNPNGSGKALEDLDGYAGTGSAAATMSGRVSYTFGLEGPSMTVDTACSSSLVTTHLACTALRQGECDMAVSAGVSLMLSPGVHVEFSRLRGMARDGRCRAFAADTEGTGWSEGSVVMVLKRLSDAQRDGDRILAVVRGSAVNHGGRSSASLTTPSGPAQKRLIRTALAASRLQASDIDYIEAHGTGTKLGDPIEGVALAEVFKDDTREEPLWVGSAKSNIGHTQAAAGLAGMLKVVLAMQHAILPQTLHVSNNPTPAVEWERANMALVQEKRSWRRRTARRKAGISAFGIGGTNAHVILEEWPSLAPAVANLDPRCDPHGKDGGIATPPLKPLLLLSGHSNAALRAQAKKLLSHLTNNSTAHYSLYDVAYSLATTRNHFRRRKVLIAQDKGDLASQLATIAAAESTNAPAEDMVQPSRGQVAMLFSGQGSQFLDMGRDLAQHFPVFRDALEEITAHFHGYLERPLLDVMWSGDADSRDDALLQRTDYAQPALFSLEVALWRLWTSWGVRPDVLLGHSIGELAVAHVAGVLNLSDAARLVAARGRLMQAVDTPGDMVSLEASASEVSAAIDSLGLGMKVDIACHNAPSQTVASGDIDAVEGLRTHFATRGRKFHSLSVSHAFHSHHIEAILADYRVVAETVHFSPPNIPIVSSLMGQRVAPGQLEQPAYWVQQARNAVRFSDGIQTLLMDHDINIFLEVGPQTVLCGMGAACVDDIRHSTIAPTWLPSIIRDRDTASVIQQSLAELHIQHVSIDWSAYFKAASCQRVDLPTYAFQREPVYTINRDLKFKRSPTSNQVTTVSTAAALHGTDPLDELRSSLIVATPAEQLRIVLSMIRETVAKILDHLSPDDVDLDLPLQDLGIDSLTALLVRNQLTAQTGLNLPAMVTLHHPNLRSLGQFLLHQAFQETLSASSPSSPKSSIATPASSGSPQLPPTAAQAINGHSEPLQQTKMPSIAPLHRVFSPLLGLNPPNTPPHLFSSAMSYFSNFDWCSRLIYDSSPTSSSSLLPGYGQAIPFIPQCFNPASPRHDQFIGNWLSNHKKTIGGDNDTKQSPPLRHMLSLFRPHDPYHIEDPLRHIPRVASLFALGEGTSGYEGVLHGGFTATLLDESISIVHEINTALGKTGKIFAAINVTASLSVKFFAPVAATEEVVCVTAWIEGIQGNNTTMKAELTDLAGNKLAKAESVFVAVNQK
ncbi:Narbonolide/10-deoxymethynolide synthase PikA1, modules 1 and 2 [Talaromyces pinophilus]|nr:Narbonolide/10-deoxymethynolide synthase PikA1, modules 1 and 2 [Talaromyces pinophilus]